MSPHATFRHLVKMIVPVKRASECKNARPDLFHPASRYISGPKSSIAQPPLSSRTPLTRLERARVCSDWFTCFLIGALTFVQFTVAFRSLDKKIFSSFGRDPDFGLFNTEKTNDVPFADRVLACIPGDNGYTPALVRSILGLATTTDTVLPGYRIVERTGSQLNSEALGTYSRVCNVASTATSFLDFVCTALGYHIATDGLHVVHGVDSNITLLFSNALPLLIMPVWDNAQIARYALPGTDGSACILRLSGSFIDKQSAVPVAYGMGRSIVEAKTADWVKQPGGIWRNGWYEGSVDKWYSFIETTKPWHSLPRARYFEALGPSELDCLNSPLCKEQGELFQWGRQFSVQTTIDDSTSIVVFNGTQFGAFWFEGTTVTSIRSAYNWQTALSNSSVALLVFR